MVFHDGHMQRFFVLQTIREGHPVPMALHRRTDTRGRILDEVLRDIDVWDADSRGAVAHAVDRYLDSDLDEISADQADEFMAMVKTRSYRPFSRRPAGSVS